MDTDEILIAQTEDRIRRAYDRNMMTSGDFLDMHQKKVLTDRFMTRSLPVKMVFYGGYADAERCIPVFLPEYIEWSGDYDDVPWDLKELVSVIRVSAQKGGRRLSHRDYLGSLLGLGIERRLTGDILVRDGGADIIIVPGIEEFLLKELHRIGSVEVKTEAADVSELIVPEARVEYIRDSVSSIRLDSVVSSAFRLSRSRAAEAIRKGLVSVDHAECIKPDAAVPEGSAIVLKGKGKAVLEETGGESRKGRIRIVIKRFI